MAEDEEDPTARPPHRDSSVTIRVDPKVLEDAQRLAKKEKRSLSQILRSFLLVWTQNEWPTPPVLPDEKKKAKRRQGKK